MHAGGCRLTVTTERRHLLKKRRCKSQVLKPDTPHNPAVPSDAAREYHKHERGPKGNLVGVQHPLELELQLSYWLYSHQMVPYNSNSTDPW